VHELRDNDGSATTLQEANELATASPRFNLFDIDKRMIPPDYDVPPLIEEEDPATPKSDDLTAVSKFDDDVALAASEVLSPARDELLEVPDGGVKDR